MYGQIGALIGALRNALESVGEAGTIVNVGRKPSVPREIGREAGVEGLALIVIDGDVIGAEVAGGVIGNGAGKAANNVAALLGDLIRIGEMKLAEAGQLR